MKKIAAMAGTVLIATLMGGGVRAVAQPVADGQTGQGPGQGVGQGMGQSARPLMGLGPGGRWWNMPWAARQLGLTDQQRAAMDQIFLQHRLNLVDLRASLQKAELMLEPLISADQPDDAKILAQIDHVAQARAELEKGNARMLLDIRHQLTPEQWTKVRAFMATRRKRMAHGMGPDAPGRGGPGRWRQQQGMQPGGANGPGGPGGPENGPPGAPQGPPKGGPGASIQPQE